MAIIYSYPSVASLESTDLFIISRTPEDPDEISNFTVDLNQISSYIITLLELDFAGDVGTGAVDLSPQEVFNIIGTSNEIETTANAQTLQIGLPDNVTITNNLIVGGTGNFTGQVTIPLTPVANTDAASKSYVDALSDKNFVFTQTTPSTSWVAEHNLGKYPSITVVDTANTVIYGEYIYNSINQTTLNFTHAFAGKAYFN